MGLAAQRQKLRTGVIAVFGLVKPDAIAFQHLIRGNDNAVGLLAIHAQRLHFGQGFGGFGGVGTFGLHRLFIAVLVNHRGNRIAINTCICKHGVTCFAA